jgi:hypothetical protein
MMSLFRARFGSLNASISMAYYKLTPKEEFHITTACEAIDSLRLHSSESRACHIIICNNNQNQDTNILVDFLNKSGHKTFVMDNVVVSVWGRVQHASCTQIKESVINLDLDL